MRFVVEVENEDGSASVLSRGEHGQPRQELELMADRWRAAHLFGSAPIRVVAEDQPERRAAPRREAVPVELEEMW